MIYKYNAEVYIKKNLTSNEHLIGFFQGFVYPKVWISLMRGPLSLFYVGTKHYIVAVTDKVIHFHKLNLAEKFVQNDFFSYEQIKALKIGKARFSIPVKFFFKNGTKLEMKALIELGNNDRVENIDKKTVDYMKEKIRIS